MTSPEEPASSKERQVPQSCISAPAVASASGDEHLETEKVPVVIQVQESSPEGSLKVIQVKLNAGDTGNQFEYLHEVTVQVPDPVQVTYIMERINSPKFIWFSQGRTQSACLVSDGSCVRISMICKVPGREFREAEILEILEKLVNPHKVVVHKSRNEKKLARRQSRQD